jgi:tetratricopeptide (TPR) repeat protein
MRVFIASHKKSLSSFPRDGIMWVDLSLLYTMQGQVEKAKRAMTVALTLQPQSRFVLRAAARLFIHLGEPDRAQRLLKRSPMSKRDPWIMAAEIAVATSSQQIAFSVDAAKDVLAGSRFSASDTTELSAAMATLEYRDGNNRKAKKHIRSGLEKPNENSLAQAKWLFRRINLLKPEPHELSVQDFNVERSFEASMWEAYLKKHWNTAISNGLSWMRDQPFSSRPVQITAHLASSLLEDWDTAITLAQHGLIANPHDNMLHVLLAFAYASKDQTEPARKHLDLVKGSLSANLEVAIPANEGLIAFRQGNVDLGRVLYKKAIEKAEDLEDEHLAGAALCYLAREEIRAKTSQALIAFSLAEEAVKKLGNSSVEAPVVLERLREHLFRL